MNCERASGDIHHRAGIERVSRHVRLAARGATGLRFRDLECPYPAPEQAAESSPMKVLLVQPSRLEPDGSVYKNKTRWLLGMTLPYLAALSPPGTDVAIKDDLYEEIDYGQPCDLVGLTCMSHQS